MIRLLLAILAMFFLPFFLYAAYTFIRRRGKLEGNLLEDAPVNWLMVAGTILAIGTLARLVSMDIIEYERQPGEPVTSQGQKTPGRSP
jgi:hypothetical protein